MVQENITRSDVLKKLNISEDTLTLYEQELEISSTGEETKSFTEEDLRSLELMHRLRESGLTYNEVKLLSSFSEVIKNADFEGKDSIKNLLLLSPIYRLKQSLNLTKQELKNIRMKVAELEEALKKATENLPKDIQDIKFLKGELETKQKTVDMLDRKLSEVTRLKQQLELQLAGRLPQIQSKGKKAKELYEMLIQKELEVSELKKKNEESQVALEESYTESDELKEQLELADDSITEIEQEVEERYKEQITSLREQIEGLIDKKQKEWDSFYTNTSEQHRKEILTLQKKHEQEILRLKQKIRELLNAIEELKTLQNPFLGLLKIGSKER